MKRWLPLLVLALGLGLAAASGARLGEPAGEARRTAWDARPVEAAEAPSVPPPSLRLSAWWQAGGPTWLLGVLLIVGGAALARRQRRADFAGHEPGAPPVDLLAALDALDARLPALLASLDDLPDDDAGDEVRDALDLLHVQVIEPVVEGRGQLMARHGVSGFAEYFGAFSGGERQLFRAWSALADGHPAVAHASVEQALASFEDARSGWAMAEEAIASASTPAPGAAAG